MWPHQVLSEVIDPVIDYTLNGQVVDANDVHCYQITTRLARFHVCLPVFDNANHLHAFSTCVIRDANTLE
jgi:hypothetical protein